MKGMTIPILLLLRIAAFAALLGLRVGLSMADSSQGTGRIRGEDGSLSVTIAVPLSSDGKVLPLNGWQYMASAVLAVDHFNARDPSVVMDLMHLHNCGIKLNATVIDTGTGGHQAMKSVLRSIQQKGPPDAIAGPYNEVPALELSVLATGLEAPMVAFRGLDQNLVLPEKHPFYSQINPDLHGEMDFLGEFLKHTGRTNFIAVIYTSEDSVLQRMETLRVVLKETVGVKQIKAFGYQSVAKTHQGDNRGIREAVWKVSQTGFRTILMVTDTPGADTPHVGQAARDYGLDVGDHFWILPGGLVSSATNKDDILYKYQHDPVGGFLRGAAFLYIFESHHVDPQDKFEKSFRQQNASFVERLRKLNPVPDFYAPQFLGVNFTNNEILKVFPPDDIFQQFPYLMERIGFAYDATMAIGIGACIATMNQNGSTAMTGETHLKGIQSVHFRGVSGRVKFLNLPQNPGSRDGKSVYYGVINLLPFGADGDVLQATSFLDPDTQEWVEVLPFSYSDGTHSPPLPLRTQPEQNYLSAEVRSFGLVLMSICLLVISASAVWVFVHSHHNVMIAAQPPLLLALCLGSTTTSLVILMSSFDEGSGWTDAMLDKACVAVPWLASLGHIVTYSALFTKLWRVNNVLQFRGTRIKVSQVAWPSLFLILAAAVILAVWTAVADFGWEREEIDDLTGESIGRCVGNYSYAFLVPVGIICVIPTLLTGFLAWKTSDVDNLYSESKWIFSLILVQLQVIVVGVPVIAILQDVSPDGRFVGLSLLMSTFPLSTMGLILVPKMLAVRREQLGVAKGRAGSRDSQEGTRVSGIGVLNRPSDPSSLTANATQPFFAPTSSLASHMGFPTPRLQVVTME